ncbi:NADPH-dependent FMN reductase [Streptomyces swartbergensis]|uniref:NADPH-dependent FMN reductase-like domain-containing protein n=1 Tax=Streptomyces swartbergensis TaxID=487165 RepID=A0A243SB70_9ACTN|nr:NADPH-dependent FMN reductase [Streptomyces swartbergensis]OUD04911.1 hypothetical protein CA983_01935 [Streptomyces swartbergensis]
MTSPEALLICGSPSVGSHSREAVATAAECLAELGGTNRIWDLATRPLPILDAARHGRGMHYADPAARELVALADRADVLVLASPMYHGSFSGAMKNALDHLDTPHVQGKPVGVLAHGENLSATQVCDSLRVVVRALKGLAVPDQLVTVPTDFTSTHDGRRRLTSPAARARLTAMSRQLIALSSMPSAVGAFALHGN